MPNQQQTNSQSQNKTNSITSEIDLSQLTLQELMDLKDRVNAKLASAYLCRMAQDDVVIEYEVKARTKDNVFYRAEGDVQLPSILHPGLVATALGRFESSFATQVMEPLSVHLDDYIVELGQNRRDESQRLLGTAQQIGDIPRPI